MSSRPLGENNQHTHCVRERFVCVCLAENKYFDESNIFLLAWLNVDAKTHTDHEPVEMRNVCVLLNDSVYLMSSVPVFITFICMGCFKQWWCIELR